jgi:hypothetical protein
MEVRVMLSKRKVCFENLIALYISIERECPPEVAFKWLDRYLGDNKGRHENKPRFPWSKDDVEDIVALRSSGVSWDDIGEMYGAKSALNMISQARRLSIEFDIPYQIRRLEKV